MQREHNPEASRPYIERTAFTPQDPPDRVRFYFCPACGKSVRGTYNLDPARKSCTKTWHLATPVGADYVRVRPDAETA